MRARVWGSVVLTCCAVLAVSCGSSARRAPTTVLTGPFPKDYFLPGGIRTLAKGRVHRGPTFAISAERYRFEGKIYVSLSATTEGGASGSFSPHPERQPLTWSTQEGCSVHPLVTWSIFFGLLRDRTDRAFVYTDRAQHRVGVAAIPPAIHLPGVLGYAALSQAPERVLVLGTHGRVIQDESFGPPRKEACNPNESSSIMAVGSSNR